MDKPFWHRIRPILKKAGVATAAFLAVAGIFLSGVYFGYYKRPAIDKVFAITNKESALYASGSNLDFDPFWKAWSLLENKYVANDGIDRQAMIWGAIEGMTKSLNDPYTVFFPPTEKEIFESQIKGDFEGVGMEIGIRKNILTVIAPLKNTPADRAGIKSGDKIVKINDKVTSDLTVDKAVKLIRGPKGTTVVLTILRDDEEKTREISVTRDRIEIPVMDTQKIEAKADGDKSAATPKGIFVMRLYSFGENSGTAFRSALREMALSGNQKLILDLRSNPGGYLEMAVDIASWFLPMGKVVAREKFGDDKEILYRSRGYGALENVPLVILVNEGSASASEILAGALQENGKATLVGAKTFGKGSVQELMPITDDTALKVTIARWLTPNGKSISEKGLEPDVLVQISEQDSANHKDPQMDKAVEILKNL
ncbi:MAG: S41 family peptidase [Candidatus Niyogibacteria bacterium]|nr:S41 family peptidase [Candidatus Niyogibacteria bacterium]